MPRVVAALGGVPGRVEESLEVTARGAEPGVASASVSGRTIADGPGWPWAIIFVLFWIAVATEGEESFPPGVAFGMTFGLWLAFCGLRGLYRMLFQR